ncbi:Exoglucanase 2 [Paramyrothecium foliicola]|nr:Exoglucanase 2 [Paramyrothecium foliicola]
MRAKASDQSATLLPEGATAAGHNAAHDPGQSLEKDIKRWTSGRSSIKCLDYVKRDLAWLKKCPAEQRKAVKKRKSASPDAEPKVLYSCDRLMCHWYFPSGQGPKRLGFETQTKLLDEDSFMDWICRIRGRIEAQHEEGLRLMSAFVEQPDHKDFERIFSFWHQALATVQGRVFTIHSAPALIAMVVVENVCNVNFLDKSPYHDEHDDELFMEPTELVLPSTQQAMAVPANDKSRSSEWNPTSMVACKIDPNMKRNIILLSWMRQATSYTTDLNVFIWEDYKRPPLLEYAKVIFGELVNTDNLEQTIIAFRSCRAHTEFTKKRNGNSTLGVPKDFRAASDPVWSAACETILSLQCVFEVLIEDTAAFLNASHREICRMTTLVRRYPSTSKMRFLLHQQDCLASAQTGLCHSQDVLASLQSWADHHLMTHEKDWEGGSSMQDRFKTLQMDIGYLEEQANKLIIDVREAQDLLRQHFHLSQDLRLFRLSILAAIFLPLSFATSFFGMNIEGGIREGPRGFSKWINGTLETVPADLRNQTTALLSAIGTSDGLSYSWQTFGITAACLLLTLPLSLMLDLVPRGPILKRSRLSESMDDDNELSLLIPPSVKLCRQHEIIRTMAAKTLLLAALAGFALAAPLEERQACASQWGQCGGREWTGPKCCASGSSCVAQNEWYAQCLPGAGPVSSTTTRASSSSSTRPSSSAVPSSTRTASSAAVSSTSASRTSTAGTSTTTKPPPVGSGTATWSGNPFSGVNLWANAYYSSEIHTLAIPKLSGPLATAAAKVAEVPTFQWLDTFAKTPLMRGALADIRAANKAGGNYAAQFVVYDLPDRDCAAAASNGEYAIIDGGVAKYKNYIDTIRDIILEYSDIRILLVIEPDSLANLVTNLNVPKCQNAQAAYLECTNYAITKLDLPNVAQYLDVGHAGWLGWPENQKKAAPLFAKVWKDAGRPKALRGLVTNVSNYNAWQITGSPPAYTNPNPVYDEEKFVNALGPLLVQEGWTDVKFITDQGRSGKQPTGQQEWGHWCNAKGTGFGRRPSANTGNQWLDAFVWVKPGGECDGTSDTSAARYDHHCGLPSALQPAPEAGQWFQAYFEQLLNNANPSFL